MKAKNILKLLVLAILAVILSAVVYFGIPLPDAASKTLSAVNIKQGLDLRGGVYIVYEADIDNPSAEEMSSAISMLQARLDANNWSEAEVAQEGENRIRIEIPDVEDAAAAVDEIGQTAQLVFCDEETAMTIVQSKALADSQEASGEITKEEAAQLKADRLAALKEGSLVDGNMVENATKQAYAENNTTKIVVSLEFNSEGKEAFAAATKENIGKPLCIFMDDELISYPTVNAEITNGSAIIEGGFTSEYADELAGLIRSGSLPFTLKVLEFNTVGARLGANSLQTSLVGGAVGIALIFIFMLIFYRLLGFAADWALVIYITLDLIALNAFNVTLTLSGVAGIILSIGMAVDANVIIFERIKEEIRSGRGLRLAIDNGFSRAFPAIFDSNITTIIAGAVLFYFGTGTVKGFAQTLVIGIVISMFTAIVITSLIVKGLAAAGISNTSLYLRKGGKVNENN